MPSGGKFKTHDQFQKEFNEQAGSEYSLKSTYTKANTKINVKHLKCGETYQVTPSHFLRGTRCPKCFGNNRKTTEQYKKQVFDVLGCDYQVVSDYVNAKIKVTIRHNVCDSLYEVAPFSVLKGHGCPICAGRYRYTHKQFIEEIENLVKEEYGVIGHYESLEKKLLIKHNLCGYVYEVKPSRFLNGRRCPNCAGNILKTTEVFAIQLKELVRDDYTLLSEYISAKEKIKIQHRICGYTYEVTPDNFLRGRRCRYCTRMSEPEKEIFDFLVANKIEFEIEFTFDDLKNKAPLRFDFKIKIDKISFFLLEYDGQQHYVGSYSDSEFSSLRVRDKMKDDYCMENDIRLLRIPYWENSIDVLSKELYRYGIQTKTYTKQLSFDLF